MHKYCQECGELLINKELENEGIVPYCPKCQQHQTFKEAKIGK